MAPSAIPPPHIIPPTAPHTHTLIALHGRGSQVRRRAFEEKTASGLNLPQTFLSCKWIFPSSQERYSNVFQEEIDEWFDIYSLTNPSAREKLQLEGLLDSVINFRGLVNKKVRSVAAERVVLLGLSMGCAVGLLTLLAGTSKLGAFVDLNGWLPLKPHLEACRSQKDVAKLFEAKLGFNSLSPQPEEAPMLQTPVFLAHTTDDEIIDVQLG